MSQANPITNNDNLQAALGLAKAGLAIFPARAENKRPHVKDWQTVATNDAAKIRHWWKKWPDAMPAIPTGRRNGVAVLDIDLKDGKDGGAALRALGLDPGTLSTSTVATPSGGQHLYFRWPDGMGNSAAGLPAGVDVRGQGGFVIAPGATNGRGCYRLLGGALTGDLPDWPDALRPATRGPSAVSGEPTGLPFPVIWEALMALPNGGEEYGREAWLKIGMALHCETDGDEDGREAWHEWSGQWPGYDPGATDAAWDSFKPEGGVTGWTIITDAERRGWHDATLNELRRQSDAERMLSLFDQCFTKEELEAITVAGIIGEPNPPKTKTPLGGYALDQDGIIRAFTERHKGELLFDHHTGRWHLFNSGYWQREETKLALHYAREVSTELAKRDPKAKPLKTVPTWEAVERGARTVRELSCTSDKWDRDPMLLGTPGGTVDLKTGQLRKARPEDHISKITAVAPIALDSFDPARDCPQWLAFLDFALGGDVGAIRFLQQWGGYCLTGDTREQVLLFVYGEGGSGKGTAINTITAILKDYAVAMATSTLTAKKYEAHPEEIARLHGPRLAVASETEKGSKWAENRIKGLTVRIPTYPTGHSDNIWSVIPGYPAT